ncbi:glycoside hydrolase family 2 TIM barrel-domain containing protein [Paradesertivirga mongoliensis]|uniref:beta-galactosidase n=1 Tax=Paradesertivirga mongoliensis TaxID=2100740 RepID=A0ABW4ZLV8_9SPHI|nr:glycoside hydrolase family 2 TIM barrel-domain containing protein [Pedobacter mongoliensis]
MNPIKIFFALLLMVVALPSQAQKTIIKYLSGKDKDNTVKWDFFVSAGMNSGKWTTIPVPSNWELQGFGNYNYGHDGTTRPDGGKKAKGTEKGLYKHRFIADKSWVNKQVEIVFEGVMTDTEVKLNGQLVGPVHQGGFYRFQYNVTNYIKPGVQNLLEVAVSKESADSTVNNAEREGDFWIFGGIYRPVYLKIMPQTFVQRVAIDARADGKFLMDVFAENLRDGDEILAQVKTLKGQKVGPVFKAMVSVPSEKYTLSQSFSDPELWSPEFPNLYTVDVSIKRNNIIQHIYPQRFGFRTVEVKPGDGIYVNYKKVLIKGVNRHSVWPETGRTLSRKVHLQDIGLMKDMNMNAVRMSHYPPDSEFLHLCDSIGLFVIDELTGWQQNYGTSVGEKLVKEMLARDVNHPSILLWANGNEGGWNTDLDDDYALYDPQKRVVIHPWHNFNNLDTKHYPEYSYIENAAKKGSVLLHTEMIHGLYDGGHGASLYDNWNLIRQNPRHAGGFLWVLADEGIVRRDLKDSIDTDGNHGADGIVGPHREKEGSFYAIKEIWSPVQVKRPVFDQTFTGKLEIENTYIYTDLSSCKFNWQLLKYPLAKDARKSNTILASGKFVQALAPGQTGTMQLPLPPTWNNADALRLTAIDLYGREIYTWTWPIKSPSQFLILNLPVARPGASISEREDGNSYSVTSDDITYKFDPATGYLSTVTRNGKPISFGNGPVLAGVKLTLQSFNHQKAADNSYVVNAVYAGDAALNVKWTFAAGAPAKLEYSYTQTAPANFYGITFKVDESKITGMKWLGDGPYRVWKNRLQGVSTNVWEKNYNNTLTGETFDYPEFKGYHANLYWAKVQAGESSFTVYTDRPDLYLQMLKPQRHSTTFIPHVNPPFPEGNLGFLDAIAPIGNKFRPASTMGPQSQVNEPATGTINGRLYFEFKN